MEYAIHSCSTFFCFPVTINSVIAGAMKSFTNDLSSFMKWILQLPYSYLLPDFILPNKNCQYEIACLHSSANKALESS